MEKMGEQTGQREIRVEGINSNDALPSFAISSSLTDSCALEKPVCVKMKVGFLGYWTQGS